MAVRVGGDGMCEDRFAGAVRYADLDARDARRAEHRVCGQHAIGREDESRQRNRAGLLDQVVRILAKDGVAVRFDGGRRAQLAVDLEEPRHLDDRCAVALEEDGAGRG